jgi:dihydroorotase-like cyclic amidohydrolase
MSLTTTPQPETNMHKAELVIRGGLVVKPSGSSIANIVVRDGVIAGICGDADTPPADRVIEAAGLHVFPGMWHVHVHFREPGHTYKENFESGSRAAAAGGITMCLDMTNNTPHPTTLESFEQKKELVAPKAHIDYALYGGGLYPKTVSALAKAGAIGIKIFNTRHIKEIYPYISELGVVDHGILYELFEAAADVGILTAVHHDDSEWCKRLTFRDYVDAGRVDAASYREAYQKGYMYGHGMVAGLAASLYYARIARARLHVLHLGVMPVDAYEMIRHAKEHFGQDVTAELETAALLMTLEQAQKVGPNAYLWAHSPEAGWESIRNGVADMLVGEHAPHTLDDTQSGWQDNFSVPLGITGAQEFIPLILNEVNHGRLTVEDVARLCAEAPARRFGIYPRKGAIEPGADADFTIANMKAHNTFAGKDMHSRAGHTSWEGVSVSAMPVYTIVRGQIVMDHGQIVGAAGYGRFIPGPQAVIS